MIELLKTKLENYDDEDKYHYLREELQLIILSIIDTHNYFKNIAFLGGTALRIIYKIRRFSEDLDFSLINSDKYLFDDLVSRLESSLIKRNFKVSIKTKRSVGAVRSLFIRFSELLYELGLSPLPDQKISIKFEIDENPPLGFKTCFTSIRDDYIIGVNQFDKSTLYSGKLNAILARQYTKGRDFFDLLWFMGKNIEPNYEFLNNGLNQQSKKNFSLDKQSLKQLLIKKVCETDFEQVRQDLKQFIMDKDSLVYYEKKLFLEALEEEFQ